VTVAEPLLEVPEVELEVLGVVLEVVVVVVVVVERCVLLVGVLVWLVLWLLVWLVGGTEERLVLLDGFPLFALTSATATPAARARSSARAISQARPAPNEERGSAMVGGEVRRAVAGSIGRRRATGSVGPGVAAEVWASVGAVGG
jgi:hypothetical protein